MIVIICAKYKKDPSRTVNATERTRFSKSRPNDLEDIGQGQRSLCASRTVDVTERTRQADGWTDGRSETNIPPNNFVVRGV